MHFLRYLAATWLATAVVPSQILAADSQWAYPGASGRLIYTPDVEGDRILDFSGVGYRGQGTALIPDIPTVVTVAPGAGDDTSRIQTAINQVAALPLGPNGFRGAVQLGPGDFDVASQLNIGASGIVLRGAGRDAGGTVLHARSTTANSVLISVNGTGSQTLTGSTRNMIDKVVPAGATSFRVDSTSGFTVGDTVRVERPSTANWISDLGMDQIPPRSDGGEVVQWQPASINIRYDRTITRIEGNRIFLDAPLSNSFTQEYGGGTIRRYTWSGRIENVGVENMRAESVFASATDENHAWDFVSIDRAQNVWVRNTTSQYFAGSAVVSNPNAKWVTVDNAINLDPKSQITGERRYTFDLSGQMELVTDSQANSGRHDFVNNSSRPAGPHVFHRSVSNNALDESGPHQRWATGSLFDNVTVNGDQLNVRNRGNFGTGHGWAGANMVIWNSKAQSFIVQNPPTAQNWLIGSTGAIVNDLTFGAQPPGYVDSHGTRVSVDSLYETQLADASDITEFHWNAASGDWNNPAGWLEGLTPDRYDVQSRDYLIGDIDSLAYDGPASVDNAAISAAWQSTVTNLGGGPITGFDNLSGVGSAAFTIGHQLSGERVIHASLALALREAGGSSAGDYVRLFDADADHRATFAELGWQSGIGPLGAYVGVIDLGGDLAELQSGEVNVQVAGTGVDWALYVATVAKAMNDTSRAAVHIDNGGSVDVTSVLSPLGSLDVGAGQGGTLRIAGGGRVQIVGDYEQSGGGVLELHHTGQLVAGGDVALDGGLQVTLGPSVPPAIGQQFPLIQAGAISGSFDSISLPSALAGAAWGLDITNTAVTLGVYFGADFNHDGSVDGQDLAAWRIGSNLGGPARHQDGDANGDGAVDGADFLTWQLQLGQSVSIVTSVPEPSTLLIGAIAAAMTRLGSHRRRQTTPV